jgi:hypothetical protein
MSKSGDHIYLLSPSLDIAFTRASFFNRPSPKPIMRNPFAATPKAAMYLAYGDMLKSGQGSMNTRPAKICTSFLLSICAQFFSHAIKDGAKFTTSPKFPQKLSNQKLPQHTGQVIPLEKAQVGIQNGMWMVCIVGKNAITFIQICKKSSQGQEEQW